MIQKAMFMCRWLDIYQIICLVISYNINRKAYKTTIKLFHLFVIVCIYYFMHGAVEKYLS